MANPITDRNEDGGDDDNDHDVALGQRTLVARAPTSQRRIAMLEEQGVTGLSRKVEDHLLGGTGRKGKRPDKVKAAKQRRRRLS
jgi:hypothetical protein